MYRSNFTVSIFMLVFFAFCVKAQANTLSTDRPYIVVDIATGQILSQQKADDRWYPASLTKLMTAYVTFRAINSGEVKEGSPVVISKAATRQPPSRMDYKKGVNLRIDTALKIIIIKSANDVSYALGEAVAGTLDAFVDRMNIEAARLGMRNTRFANSNGLHNKNQYTSARDMAILSAQILKEFPQYAYLFEAVAIKTSVKTHYSYNLLLERFSGANGMKTGFVCASGYNMVASATRGGRTLIAVVLGTSSQSERAISAAHLLNSAFDNPADNGSGESIYANAKTGVAPRSMRPVLCTEKARANRYEPGAGQAKIDSSHLQAREISTRIVDIKTGGIDAAPGKAWLERQFSQVVKRIPIPKKRPDYNLKTGSIILSAIGAAATGNIPLPTPRPR